MIMMVAAPPPPPGPVVASVTSPRERLLARFSRLDRRLVAEVVGLGGDNDIWDLDRR